MFIICMSYICTTFELSKTSTASSSSKMFPGAESICKILFSTSSNALEFSAPSTINFCRFDSKSGLWLRNKYYIYLCKNLLSNW